MLADNAYTESDSAYNIIIILWLTGLGPRTESKNRVVNDELVVSTAWGASTTLTKFNGPKIELHGFNKSLYDDQIK